MNNFDEIGLKKYQPAGKIKISAQQKFVILMGYICILIKSFIEYIPTLIQSIVQLILGVKPKNISGQLALVTGGANGLGKEIAIALAKKGCNIAIADLDFVEAESLASEIANEFKVKAKAFKTDVSDFKSIQKLKDDIEDQLGFVDILVNNAGLLSLISLREGKPEDVQKVIDVNLTSHFWTNRTFLNGMIKRKRGHIVAIGSIASFCPINRACAYCATKFGVRGLMKALYIELCCDNHEEIIKLTTVCPWFINTRKELIDTLDKMSVIPFKLDPEECAEVIINGIVKNKELVIIPSKLSFFLKIIDLVPRSFAKFCIPNFVKTPGKKFMDNGLE